MLLQSCISKGIGHQGVGPCCKAFLRLSTTPCRHTPLLVHFSPMLLLLIIMIICYKLISYHISHSTKCNMIYNNSLSLSLYTYICMYVCMYIYIYIYIYYIRSPSLRRTACTWRSTSSGTRSSWSAPPSRRRLRTNNIYIYIYTYYNDDDDDDDDNHNNNNNIIICCYIDSSEPSEAEPYLINV